MKAVENRGAGQQRKRNSGGHSDYSAIYTCETPMWNPLE
jgi:hypothetical protein